MTQTHKVALLTAGGLAPCLSSSVAGLIERYSDIAPEIEIMAYYSGYQGLLTGNSVQISLSIRENAPTLHQHGGSPIGNSRVKFSNVKDCLARGLIKEGEIPLEVAANQLARDGVTILHTIGGDDTNTSAAELKHYLEKNGHELTVVGLPKTVDNDIVPIKQSLGAFSAAEAGALFADHVSNEQSAAPKTLVIHEIMGRHSGWLTAATARAYNQRIQSQNYCEGLMMNRSLKDIDAVYIPELTFNIEAEIERLSKIMQDRGFATLFVSEGACMETIIQDRIKNGQEIARDAFGHVKLDTINVGDWFAKQIGKSIKSERTIVQKSGYFARSAPANAQDLRLIKGMVDLAVQSALSSVSGVIGHDQDNGGRLSTIAFERISGGKHFDPTQDWFKDIIACTGQS
jgi:diphosphate-dependent phosphofructokinase